jgi:hypothetical protein
VLGKTHGNLPGDVKKDTNAGKAVADSSPARPKIKVSLTIRKIGVQMKTAVQYAAVCSNDRILPFPF